MWIRMGCGLGWDVDWDGLLWVGMWIRMGCGLGWDWERVDGTAMTILNNFSGLDYYDRIRRT